MDEPTPHKLSTVGHYRVQKTIGRGQFGKVRSAVHDVTGEKVALKLILKSKLDETTLNLVKREIMIMKLLDHPNIIKLHEVMETEDLLVLVMEYASGGELVDLIIAHGRLQEQVARRFFRQIVTAIDYCHGMHVVHRDIKLENILLDSQFHIKLIDFGLSNVYVPGQYLKTFCGSPTYTAPELIQRHQYEGPEVDIWSLGVVLFVLVTGELPFDGDNFTELFTKIVTGVYQTPDFLSSDCRALITSMLQGSPSNRATLEEIRNHAWSLHNGLPIPSVVVPSHVHMHVPGKDVLDQTILDHMEAVGYNKEHIVVSLENGAYNDAVATYYLLVGKTSSDSSTPSVDGKGPAKNVDTETNRLVTITRQTKRHTPTVVVTPQDTIPPIGGTNPTDIPSSPQLRHPPWKNDAKLRKKLRQKPLIPGLVTDGTLHRRHRTVGSTQESEKAKTIRRSEPTRSTPPPSPPQGRLRSQATPSRTMSPLGRSIEGPSLEQDQVEKDITPSKTDSTYPNIVPTRRSPASPKQQERVIPPANPSRDTPHRKAKGHRRPHSHDVKDTRDDMIIPVPGAGTTAATHQRLSNEEAMNKLVQSLHTTFNRFTKPEKSEKPEKPEKPTPREVRIPLNTSTTTHQPPEIILSKINHVLVEKNLNFILVSPYCLECKSPELVFELEICTLPYLQMHGIRFHRKSGDVWRYQEMCKQILEELKLNQT